MHSIGRFQIPFKTFLDSIEEEIVAVRAAREVELEAMEEVTEAEDEYIGKRN